MVVDASDVEPANPVAPSYESSATEAKWAVEETKAEAVNAAAAADSPAKSAVEVLPVAAAPPPASAPPAVTVAQGAKSPATAAPPPATATAAEEAKAAMQAAEAEAEAKAEAEARATYAALLRRATDAQAQFGAMAGAELLFGLSGLPPERWGISKSQVEEVVAAVSAAQDAGEIANYTPPGLPPYPQEVFDDRKRGPNMHQVNAAVVKPHTQSAATGMVPFLSWALMHNWDTVGLPCEVFISHAWDEPFYEFAARVLAEWPDDCKGAYICTLSNPQNVDIGALLGDTVDTSPFFRILHSPTAPPKELIMVANSRVAIHTRLWCVLEAHEAKLERIRISGPAREMLTGPRAGSFNAQYEAAIKELETSESKLSSMSLNADGEVPQGWVPPGGVQDVQDLPKYDNMTPSDAAKYQQSKAKAEPLHRSRHIMSSIEQHIRSLTRSLNDLISSSDVEMVDLQNARCSYVTDERMIRAHIAGNEASIQALVSRLIREQLEGITNDFKSRASNVSQQASRREREALDAEQVCRDLHYKYSSGRLGHRKACGSCPDGVMHHNASIWACDSCGDYEWE